MVVISDISFFQIRFSDAVLIHSTFHGMDRSLKGLPELQIHLPVEISDWNACTRLSTSFFKVSIAFCWLVDVIDSPTEKVEDRAEDVE